jgi:hypothetical protein
MLDEETEEAEYGRWISATGLLPFHIVCPTRSKPGNPNQNFDSEGEWTWERMEMMIRKSAA